MNEGTKLAVRLKVEIQEMEKTVESLRNEVEQLKRYRADQASTSLSPRFRSS
jgi:uncharacterized protein YicC (UPF0701 family)